MTLIIILQKKFDKGNIDKFLALQKHRLQMTSQTEFEGGLVFSKNILTHF